MDVRRSVAKLAHRDRLLIYLIFWLDLSIEEAALVLGVSPSAAKGRLRRAVGRLRLSAAVIGGLQ